MEFFKIEQDKVRLELNPKIYDIEAVYSAGYQMIEDAFVRFDGDPDAQIIVYLSHQDQTKNKEKDLAILAKKYLNQLVNYTYYKINSKNKEALRALLLKKSFESINLASYDESAAVKRSTAAVMIENSLDEEEYVPNRRNNDTPRNKNNGPKDDIDSEIEDILTEEDLEFDDPDGIAIPWEEKFGDEDPDDDSKCDSGCSTCGGSCGN